MTETPLARLLRLSIALTEIRRRYDERIAELTKPLPPINAIPPRDNGVRPKDQWVEEQLPQDGYAEWADEHYPWPPEEGE